MKSMRKALAAVLCAAMVVALVPSGSADAAKKPSVKKKVSVAVGKTAKIKVKNAAKNAKVTWKTSNKKVVKLGKKVVKVRRQALLLKV